MRILAAHSLGTALRTVCPVAPPGAQAYADQMTGYVMWGVLILLGIGVIVGLGAIVGGRVFSLPHASKAGIVSLVMMFISGIAYMVVPPMVAGITGAGCV